MSGKISASVFLLVFAIVFCYSAGPVHAQDDGHISVYGAWLFPISERSTAYDLSDHHGGGISIRDENWRLDGIFLAGTQKNDSDDDDFRYDAYRSGVSLFYLVQERGFYYGTGAGVWYSKLHKTDRTELAVEAITGYKVRRFEVFTRLIYWPDSRNFDLGSIIGAGITF